MTDMEAALQTRIMELEMDRVVPGQMVCDVCSFALTTTILDVANGRAGAPIAPSAEPCPNGCGPLRSLTWHEDVKRADASMMRAWEALEEAVKLMGHYAQLLNMHDGGQRIVFDSPAAWMNRLDELKAQVTGGGGIENVGEHVKPRTRADQDSALVDHGPATPNAEQP